MNVIDVTVDRDKYIGGSDIPIIMGISPFKKRWDLLLEKAGLKENDFSGNKYTNYGDVLEPKIRAYINDCRGMDLVPNQIIDGDLRGNMDGFNGACVLEIKTTSHIYETVEEYKLYLVQLLFYMAAVAEVENGILAVYERPEDFNAEFDPMRLTVYDIDINDYVDLVNEIYFEIDRFRADLKRLKENPLLSEEDFLPQELVAVSNQVAVLEKQMIAYKDIEKQYKAMKQALYEAMTNHNIKSWTTYNGTKITRVAEIPSTIEEVWDFDMDTFLVENPDIYRKYAHKIKKNKGGRSGYVKISLPK